MTDPKTSPATPSSKPAAAAAPVKGAPRPYKAPKAQAGPARVFPAAAPTVTAAVDKPARPYQRPEAPDFGPATAASGGVTGSVSVQLSAKPGKFLKRAKPAPAALPPETAAPAGFVTPGTPVEGSVHVQIQAIPVDPSAPSTVVPNATRWRFPSAAGMAMPAPAPLSPVDAAAATALASAAARITK